MTFLPGFVPHGYPVAWVSLLFGAIFVAMTAAYFALLLTASRAVLQQKGRLTHLRLCATIVTGVIVPTDLLVTAKGAGMSVDHANDSGDHEDLRAVGG